MTQPRQLSQADASAAEADIACSVHGGLDLAELARHGIDPAEVLDLSVNVNPFGPHPAVAHAVAQAALADYPDRRDTRARAALGRALDRDPARILLGHGSVELLWALVADLPRERPLLIVGPTFGEAENAARAHGVPVARLTLSEADAFEPDAGAIGEAIERHRAGAVYICQPNNPTGRGLPGGELAALTTRHRDARFIVDQAFLSLSERHTDAGLRFDDHVALLRSLTKDHGLAGLRVGYALLSPEWIARLAARRPPWMTSSLAQAAIEAAAEHPEHVAEARRLLLASRLRLSAAVAERGFAVIPSQTHYFLFRVRDAEALRARWLVRHRLLVRSARSFGLPRHVRVAASGPEAEARVMAALADESPP